MYLWKTFKLKPGLLYFMQIDSLFLYIKHNNGDWYIASQREVEATGVTHLVHFKDESVFPRDLEWKRWITSSTTYNLTLSPIMPDRSLVVRPDVRVTLPQENEALFYVFIPIWIQASIGENKKTALCEIPTRNLSNTWFGDITEGELCYSLFSHAHRDFNAYDNPIFAVCPVRIKNSSNFQLEFSKFCLHGKYLRLYKSKNRLWTNPVFVNFQGPEQISNITISETPPNMEPIVQLICEARKKADNNFMKRSFQFLRRLTKS